jgi:hypothetical protein
VLGVATVESADGRFFVSNTDDGTEDSGACVTAGDVSVALLDSAGSADAFVDDTSVEMVGAWLSLQHRMKIIKISKSDRI